MIAAAEISLTGQALETLKQAGNPFRNYFARNPDDEVCARYHVADLFAREAMGAPSTWRICDPNRPIL